jgi:hypothetical protein
MKKHIAILVAVAIALSGVVFAAEDMKSNINVKRSISPVANSGNSASVGQIIDHLGYESVTYVVDIGIVNDVDATFTVLLEDCANDNCSTNAAVADGFLIGTEALASFTIADNNTVKTLGYKGNRRYTRLTVTPANNSSAATFGVGCILGHPKSKPQ